LPKLVVMEKLEHSVKGKVTAKGKVTERRVQRG